MGMLHSTANGAPFMSDTPRDHEQSSPASANASGESRRHNVMSLAEMDGAK
jgi:hypothetical protein